MIRLSKELYLRIVDAAKKGSPYEVCGLLCGEVSDGVRTMRDVYFMENTDHARNHFSIDTREQLAAVRDMRSRGFAPLGNFHSHPHGSALPSEEDRRLAYDSEASYLIVSLMGECEMRAYRLSEDKMTEEELVIEEELTC